MKRRIETTIYGWDKNLGILNQVGVSVRSIGLYLFYILLFVKEREKENEERSDQSNKI